MGVQSYRDLIVWQKAMEMTAEVYKIVKKLPKEETYSLSDQMRRAAVSIPSNIAEGQARNSRKEFINFLSIAKGSKAELETQLHLCVKIGYLANMDINPTLELLAEISKMLSALIKTLNTAH